MRRLLLILTALLLPLIAGSTVPPLRLGFGFNAASATSGYSLQTDAGVNVETDAAVPIQVDH